MSIWKQRIDLVATILMIAAAGTVIWTTQFRSGSKKQALEIPKEPIPIADARAEGRIDAPAVVVMFTDFQCPACKKFVEETKPEIEKEYITTGRVKFVVKHFPLNSHPLAPRAAEAAECAGQQDKFWDYHDLLYKNQVGISESTWTQLGSQANLEAKAFADCLGGTFRDRIAADRSLAQRLKLSGTPTFFIGTETADGQFRARQAVSGGRVLLELLRSEVPEIERSLAR